MEEEFDAPKAIRGACPCCPATSDPVCTKSSLINVLPPCTCMAWPVLQIFWGERVPLILRRG